MGWARDQAFVAGGQWATGRTVSRHGAGPLKSRVIQDRIIKSHHGSVLTYREYSGDCPDHLTGGGVARAAAAARP
jgi:hypothetical protein